MVSSHHPSPPLHSSLSLQLLFSEPQITMLKVRGLVLFPCPIWCFGFYSSSLIFQCPAPQKRLETLSSLRFWGPSLVPFLRVSNLVLSRQSMTGRVMTRPILCKVGASISPFRFLIPDDMKEYNMPTQQYFCIMAETCIVTLAQL